MNARRTVRLSKIITIGFLVLALPGLALATPPPTPPFGPEIDPYANYVGQTTCTSTPTPGAVALQELVTRAYPDVGNRGYLMRACDQGGTSEHKDGRAWDWMVSAFDVREKAAAEELLGWLTATDQYGNGHARLRRLGIMYMIWNGRIFKAWEAERGWLPYSGYSPHTDHVHFSLSVEGGAKRTTWWGASPSIEVPRDAALEREAVAPAGAVAHVAERTPAGRVLYRAWSDTRGFYASVDLGGRVDGAPTPAIRTAGTVQVFALGVDKAIYVTGRLTTGPWAAWTSLGAPPGGATTRPGAVSPGPGKLAVVTRGGDGALWLRWSRSPGSWLPWERLGGSLSAGSGPAVVYPAAGRLDVVVQGRDERVYVKSSGARGWSDWQPLGGRIRGDIATSSSYPGYYSIAVRGSDQVPYIRSVGPRGVTGPWQSLGGELASSPASAAAATSRRTDLFGTGTNGLLYHGAYVGGGWSGWRRDG